MTAHQLRPSESPSRINDFIDAASRLIARQGYDRTSVRDITRELNLTSGTMFYHFKTKDDLLEAVIAAGINEGIKQMSAVLDAADQGPLSRFLVMVSAHTDITHGQLSHIHRVWIREWDRLSLDARQRLRPLVDRYRLLVNDLLSALKRAGHLHSDLDTARHLLLPALNWTPAWADLPTESSRTRLSEQICAAILNLPVERFRSLLAQEAAGDASAE